jgi:hypothetical protein
VNDAPYLFAALPDVSFAEDGWNATINMSYYFRDIDNATLLWNYTTNNTNVTIVFNGNNFANITAAANWSGAANITLVASDGQYSVNDSIVVTVSAVNDPPYLYAAVPNTSFAKNGYNSTINMSYYFRDIDNATLLWSYIANNSNVSITFTGANLANITAAANWSGIANVTLAASDGQYSANTSILVNVTNAQPYLVSAIPNQSRTAAGSWTVNLSTYFSDIDGDPLNYTYNLTITAGSITLTIDNATGIATFSSSINSTGIVYFHAFDPATLNASSNNVTLTVTITGGGGGGGGVGGGGGGGGANCTANWTCSSWSDCLPNSTRMRTCTDSINCNTTTNRPALNESCTYSPTGGETPAGENITNITSGEQPSAPGAPGAGPLESALPTCEIPWLLFAIAAALGAGYAMLYTHYGRHRKREPLSKLRAHKLTAAIAGVAVIVVAIYALLQCLTLIAIVAAAAIAALLAIFTLYYSKPEKKPWKTPQ